LTTFASLGANVDAFLFPDDSESGCRSTLSACCRFTKENVGRRNGTGGGGEDGGVESRVAFIGSEKIAGVDASRDGLDDVVAGNGNVGDAFSVLRRVSWLSAWSSSDVETRLRLLAGLLLFDVYVRMREYVLRGIVDKPAQHGK